ncbi:Na+/melibiose symporter-like transporter [Sphingobium wenxiniae]|uniref:MFS transporter n=2 Tax=Sphingobium TaxID=165695 RepID=T0HLW5_9SPHN|nr:MULTISPECIES: MFS transporter [Sphingobium]EQA98578.1 hypothetical protein L485_18000 [Sphingobium baderi LL03]KMS61604.1 hypothetical protein V475_12445 [Sphingobium baderi LL03]MBB6193490.1 Na+/melibiose symporter-like transporter [Sphingobium wenxiniae]TWH91436.1 Na+/melibiose symporter-like transporter [Sphingobium wenxiniae]WRD75357.1 MFS transporter [Sphingobium baderi]
MSNSAHRKVDRLTLAAIASVSLPIATLTAPLVVYLPEFYTNALGLDLALVGTIFSVVRLVDIALDPVLGSFMDRTQSRWGRYRPWLALGTPLLMLSVAMLFFARPGVGPLHLLTWLIGAYAAWSIISLSQLSLSAELSPSYDERSRVYGWVQSGSIIGILLVLSLPLVIQRGQSDQYATMYIMGWLTICLMPLCAGFALMRLRGSSAAGHSEHGSLIEYLKLFRNPIVLRLLGADLLLGLASGMTSAVSIFFFTRALQLPRAAVAFMIIAHMLTAFVMAPVWTKVAQRFGKHRALSVSIGVYVLGQLLYLLSPPGSIAMAFLASAVAGCSYSAFVMFPRAMMADVGDDELLRTGVNRTALLYALLMGTWKVGQALSVGAAFVILSLMSFDPQRSVINTAAVHGLYLIYVGGPVILAMLATLAMYRYPLTSSRHAAIRAELEVRTDL